MKNIDQDIQETERKLAELKRQKELQVLSPEIRIADKLHAIKCHANHTDGCGWFYESWNKPGFTRGFYIEQARKVLVEEPNAELVLRIMNIVHET